MFLRPKVLPTAGILVSGFVLGTFRKNRFSTSRKSFRCDDTTPSISNTNGISDNQSINHNPSQTLPISDSSLSSCGRTTALTDTTSTNTNLINWHVLRQPDTIFSIIFTLLPFAVTAFASFRVYHWWKYEYFYNVFQIRLANIKIKKSQYPGYLSHFHSNSKFQLVSETLIEDEIKNIIPSVKGIRLLTRSAKKTTENNSLIKVKDIKSHKIILHYICNKIIQLNNNANLYRDIGIKGLKVEKCRYIVCLLCLKFPNDLNYSTKWDKNTSILMKEGWNCKKIRAILIKQETLENVIKILKDECDVKNLNDISDDHWRELLYIAHLKDYSNLDFAFWRWQVMKQIIIEYDKQVRHKCDGTLRWGEPLGYVSMTYIVPMADTMTLPTLTATSKYK